MSDEKRKRLWKSDQEFVEENEAWDRMRMWETLVDERIRKWLGDGNMSAHPLAGQKLDLDKPGGVPEDERLAYKIMADNDVAPAWLSLGYALREKHAKILKRLYHYARDYQRRKHQALVRGSYVKEREADERWQAAAASIRDDIAKYNSELLEYNLMVPPRIGQMVPLDADDLIDEALRAARQEYLD